MKRLFLCLVLTLTLALAIPAFAGNGLPVNGPHYNLNLIGVKDKDAAMDGNHGHRIFVRLKGKTKIWLTEGENYMVLDANGTDGDGAAFQLPNPDPDGDGTTLYSVFARALGKPGGSSATTTCFEVDGTPYCSTMQMVLTRNTGKSHFENVSKYLLYVYVDTDDDGNVERYPLFADALDGEENYYWDYDNNGLKLAQLRFYEVPTTVPDP